MSDAVHIVNIWSSIWSNGHGMPGGLHQFEGLGQRFVWRGALGSTSGDRGSLCLEADQEGPLPQQESDEGLSWPVITCQN